MKKLFFAICFNICLLGSVSAKITPISGFVNMQREIVGDKANSVKEVDRDDFSEFVSKRFKSAKKADKSEINNSVSFGGSVEAMQKKENEKNFFQKMYEKAIQRITEPSDEIREDVSSQEDIENLMMQEGTKSDNVDEQTKKWRDSSIPTVTAYLPPYNVPTEVPAIEHIPYLMNNIEILPNGMVKFEETVVVVANAQKLKSGLTKILPSKVVGTKGTSQNVDYSIINVTINDQPIKYRLSKAGNRVLLVPDKEYRLPAGIYTYKFQYLADNLILNNDGISQFYWSVGGNGWNLLVDRSFAKVTPPNKEAVIKQEAIVGSRLGFYKDSVYIEEADALSHYYTSQVPLFIGLGMHILIKMDNTAFYATTIGQKFVRSFYNYGDIYISFIGFLVVVGSLVISWLYIIKGKSRVKTSLNKTAVMIRYLLCEKFDKKSICGFLLDLYKKNIIDIQQSGETILLVKSTDNVKSLSAYEKKALKALFPSHETTFSVTKNNKLPLKRFVKILEHGLKKDVFKLNIKLNIGYVLSSLAMMFVVFGAIATFKIDSLYVFAVLVLTSLCCWLGILLWNTGTKKWLKIVARCFSINIVVFCWIIYSAVIHPFAAMLMIWSIILIVCFLKTFSKRNGLISAYIKDAQKQKIYLRENKKNIALSKGYTKYQPLIFACDLEEEIIPSSVEEYYKIPIIKNIMNRM